MIAHYFHELFKPRLFNIIKRKKNELRHENYNDGVLRIQAQPSIGRSTLGTVFKWCTFNTFKRI